ncbi:hypothetical protein [Clostridium oceanicum]|uniref:HTH cro/C1-type domain-containing protein n=1 Tax=Clostridium oceanicum TaxID=1543 RepID=A0ABN1J8P2_9CLOT
MEDKKTSELLDLLNSIDDISKLNNYVEKTKITFSTIDFCTYFENIIKENNIKKSKLIEASNIDRTYGYQILNGTKKPSRDKILQLCLSCKLNMDNTQRALILGNVGQLYAKNPRDSIIIFSINKGLNVIDTNDLLDEMNFCPLGEIN